jgi:sugar phosphate isomerase/epimerase
MQLGIFAKTFPRPTLGESLDAAASSGVDAIQFNLALTGGPSLPQDISPELAAEVHAATAERGLDIAAVSGTYNMAHPDAGIRADGRRRLATLISAAAGLGTSVVTVCTGSRDPDDMWRHHPDNASPDAWADMVTSLAQALEIAESAGVTLGIEPEHNNVVDSAASARRLLDDLGSANVKIVLDAANLIVPGELDRQHRTLREAVDLLGNDLVLAHAKDVQPDGRVVAAGRGALDYRLYVELLDEAGFHGALVLHGLEEEEVPRSVAFVRSVMDGGAAA